MPKIIHNVIWAVEELNAMLHGQPHETMVDGVHEIHQVDSPRRRRVQADVESNGQLQLMDQSEPRAPKPKLLECHVCEKRYSSQGHLRLHVAKVHPNAKKPKVRPQDEEGYTRTIPCPECDFMAHNVNGLNAHIGQRHRNTKQRQQRLAARRSGVRIHPCPICKAEMKGRMGMIMHYSRHHKAEMPGLQEAIRNDKTLYT